ncbi:hypothetical protein C8Q70DRAFT_1058378 [Cubamyces menziesii]|nr:hypothetical protein C8Q70DRAFT_1058378 [Cubamyces menziesii]
MNFARSTFHGGLLQTPPPWLRDAVRDMRARYPNDAFDVVGRLALNPSTGGHVTIFRLVCGDCPGKQCHPGPGETIADFEMHLRNHGHRNRVHARLQPRRSFL